MKNKTLIFLLVALVGFVLPVCADELDDSQRIIFEGAQAGIEEECQEDYVQCANTVSAANRKALVAELKGLDDEEKTALMTSAVKRGKAKAVDVFLDAEFVPDYNALFFAKEKILEIFKKRIDVSDRCIIITQALSDGVNAPILEKSLKVLDKEEFMDTCSTAVLTDNFSEENAQVLLDYVGGNPDNLYAYINRYRKMVRVTLLAYCAFSKTEKTAADDNEKVLDFLIENNADLNQPILPGASEKDTVQAHLDYYEQTGKSKTYY